MLFGFALSLWLWMGMEQENKVQRSWSNHLYNSDWNGKMMRMSVNKLICLSIHSQVHSKELILAAYFDFRRQADKSKTKQKILKIKPQVQRKPTQQCFLWILGVCCGVQGACPKACWWECHLDKCFHLSLFLLQFSWDLSAKKGTRWMLQRKSELMELGNVAWYLQCLHCYVLRRGL